MASIDMWRDGSSGMESDAALSERIELSRPTSPSWGEDELDTTMKAVGRGPYTDMYDRLHDQRPDWHKQYSAYDDDLCSLDNFKVRHNSSSSLGSVDIGHMSQPYPQSNQYHGQLSSRVPSRRALEVVTDSGMDNRMYAMYDEMRKMKKENTAPHGHPEMSGEGGWSNLAHKLPTKGMNDQQFYNFCNNLSRMTNM